MALISYSIFVPRRDFASAVRSSGRWSENFGLPGFVTVRVALFESPAVHLVGAGIVHDLQRDPDDHVADAAGVDLEIELAGRSVERDLVAEIRAVDRQEEFAALTRDGCRDRWM